MPIEIKELHIKAIVGTKEKPGDCLKPEDLAKLKKEITRDVTEKVLAKMQQKNER